MIKICALCKSKNIKIVYKGKIRLGKFGNFLNSQCIYECEKCGLKFYPPSSIDYSNEEYRNLVQNDPSAKTYYKNHDREQLQHLDILGIELLREKKIVDVGCGAGSFLDLVRGFTKDQIAIEPFKDYQKVLTRKGYRTFDYIDSLNKSFDKTIDIVTAFAVIEHVDNPKEFLHSMKRLISTEGFILISTPNSDDWLLKLLSDDYKSFFYRYVHKWYFNKKSLTHLANSLNFKRIEFIYKQQYDLSNLLLWLRDKKPTGIGNVNILNQIDFLYKKTLEDQGLSNYLYVKLYV